MRLGTHLAVALMALAPVALSCGQLPTADSLGSDGVVPGSGQFAPGTVGQQCVPKDDGCQWLSNDCAADPDCAHWYQCILSCKADGTVETCFAGCKGTGKVPTTHQKLENCLLASANCLGADENVGGSGGTKGPPISGTAGTGNGDGGGGGAFNGPDGGTGPGGGDASAVADPESKYDGCEACVTGACTDLLCKAATATENCAKFTNAFVITCFQHSQTEWALEVCMDKQELANTTGSVQAHADWVAAGVTKCVDENCPHLCTPADYQGCLDCERTNCKDEYGAFLDSADAQDYQWCRTKCDFGEAGKPVSDAAKCKNTCGDNHSDGEAVVGQLIGCRVSNCSAKCATLP